MNRTILLIMITLLSIFNTNKSSAQDWANLSRFKTENSDLKKAADNEPRIVFMGNSITEGWNSHYPQFFENKSFINRGISGQTTPQMLLRFRQDVINLEPAAVVILAGTNDIAGNTGPSTLEMIVDNIFSMAELAKAHGIKVILCSVLPAFDYPWKKGLEPAEKIVNLNNMIKKYANANSITYLDYFTPMSTENFALKDEYTYDGVHPNTEGYKFMAPLTIEAINNTLNLK